MKAYYGVDGKIRLFRPMENMMRLSRSAEASSLPVSRERERGREEGRGREREREKGREREKDSLFDV